MRFRLNRRNLVRNAAAVLLRQRTPCCAPERLCGCGAAHGPTLKQGYALRGRRRKGARHEHADERPGAVALPVAGGVLWGCNSHAALPFTTGFNWLLGSA